MSANHEAYRFTGVFVDELARRGVRHVCICPGSRSTPLAMTFAQRADVRLWMHLDERSAAYFALGLAKATREAVALVCTSGTAAANFLPAVVEACFAHVPLLICTADRPPELQQVGANQTVRQLHLYGEHVRLFVQMPVPDGQPEVLRYARVMAARAVTTALATPVGPVHLNFPFREPLVPPRGEGDGRGASAVHLFDSVAPASGADGRGTTGQKEPSGRHFPEHGLESRQLQALANRVRGAERGLIMGGPQDDPTLAEALLPLAATLGFPVLADPLSGLRCGPRYGAVVLDSYDAFLRDADFAGTVEPDLVLRFGATPTSKPLLQYLERWAGCSQLLLANGEWTDPTLVAAEAVEASPGACCRQLSAALDGHQPSDATRCWQERWQTAATVTRATLSEGLRRFSAPFEGRVFDELASLLPEGAICFAGNSMPVRDLDTFFPASERRLRFLANRGASGIDGVTSTALGVAAAGQGPVVLVLGDLSFYHDLNGLWAARQHGLSLTVVLINNDGGGIFSFLPQANYSEHFEQLFGTPHGLDFAPVAALYGATYSRPVSWEEFRAAVVHGLDGGLHIAELRTDRTENVRLHRELWRQVAADLSPHPRSARGGRDRPDWTTRDVEARGIRLHVAMRGEGPPLVLLHGFTGSGATWDACADALDECYTLIAPDLIGHGRSDAPASLDHYRMPEAVADLVALLDALDRPRVRLLGYSMGGRLALHLAVAHPDRLEALVLESTSPGLAAVAERQARRESDEALAERIERDGIAAFVEEWERQPLFASQQALPAATRAGLRAERLTNRPLGLANSLRGMGTGAQESLWDQLQRLTMPTLLLAGAEDVKYCQLAGAMAERLSSAHSVIVPGAGHTVHLERPAEFARCVLDFLGRSG